MRYFKSYVIIAFLQERGIVISWVDSLCEDHELIRSSWEIKRRLLEMMIHSCTSDLKEAGE